MNKQASKTPDPLEQEKRKFWHEFGKELISKSIDTMEETAKQIVGATIILEGLYFNAITFSKLQGQITNGWTLFFYILPVILLLGSLAASLFVFFPSRYPLNFFSSKASEEVFEDIVKRKWVSLQIASLILILGIAALVGTIFIYLKG